MATKTKTAKVAAAVATKAKDKRWRPTKGDFDCATETAVKMRERAVKADAEHAEMSKNLTTQVKALADLRETTEMEKAALRSELVKVDQRLKDFQGNPEEGEPDILERLARAEAERDTAIVQRQEAQALERKQRGEMASLQKSHDTIADVSTGRLQTVESLRESLANSQAVNSGLSRDNDRLKEELAASERFLAGTTESRDNYKVGFEKASALHQQAESEIRRLKGRSLLDRIYNA